MLVIKYNSTIIMLLHNDYITSAVIEPWINWFPYYAANIPVPDYLTGWSLNSHYIPDTQPWKAIFHLPSSYPPQLSCRLVVSSEKHTFVENNEKHSRCNSWKNRRTVNYILLFSVKVFPIVWFADVFDESFVINEIHHAFFTCFQDEALITCLRNVINWKLHNAVCHLILSPWALSHLFTLPCLSVICYSMFALSL